MFAKLYDKFFSNWTKSSQRLVSNIKLYRATTCFSDIASGYFCFKNYGQISVQGGEIYFMNLYFSTNNMSCFLFQEYNHSKGEKYYIWILIFANNFHNICLLDLLWTRMTKKYRPKFQINFDSAKIKYCRLCLFTNKNFIL